MKDARKTSKDIIWTKGQVEERFEEAADTLSRLPRASLHGKVTIWPQIIRDFYERLTEVKRPIHPPPSSKAIDRMDETLTWLCYLEPEERKIVWLRANGVRWKRIGARFGLHRQTVWRHWVYALEKIVSALNQKM